MFKIKNIENNMLLNDDVQVNTRLHDGPVFKITHPNSEPIKRSVMYTGALEWNSLDAEVSNARDIVSFKRIQKSYMLNTYMELYSNSANSKYQK